MNVQNKIELLNDRLNKLTANSKENFGVQRKIRRKIRSLEKTNAL